ncbi:flavohemoglobin expression-modulating QEGLA motif protein [Kistimonas scapharcae]|uniref:Flavohemoglobin expression-modulating QEGLA motif protein n=1 Tax=Kistimonas scapharcae TaxID=1036133 RepID=A0ABP8V0F7_9GAMM
MPKQQNQACPDVIKRFRQRHPVAWEIDQALFDMAKCTDALQYVNPLNLKRERKRFERLKSRYTPEFHYRQLAIDPYAFRQALYRLPVADIDDSLLRKLYCAIIDSYANKVDMLSALGTPRFLYESLRYYGEPQASDVESARFLLFAPELTEVEAEPRTITAQASLAMFEEAVEAMELTCSVALSDTLVARAMVNNSRNQLVVNSHALFTEREVQALIHHELGVHMCTTLNARMQPISTLRLGLPGNTHSQEGLAILCEYLSGNLSITRLKDLALRVMAVHWLVKGHDFSYVVQRLQTDFRTDPGVAFTVTTRVFRGGGFTKDYVYLSGLRDLLKCHASGQSLARLLLGKMSLPYRDVVEQLLARGDLVEPVFQPPALSMTVKKHPVMEYLVNSIQ